MDKKGKAREGLISVVLPLYNGEAYIEEQVRSILDQTKPPSEIVIVDDCSTDNSVAIVKGLDDPRIVFRSNMKNIGLVSNIRTALELASGDLIFLSDQDDVWKPDKIQKMCEFMWRHPACFLAISDCSVTDDSLNVLDESYMDVHLKSLNALDAFFRFRLLGSSICMRRDLSSFALPFLKNVEPLHDVVLYFCCKIAFGGIGVVREPLYLYRRHNNTMSSAAEKTTRKLWSILVSRLRTLRLIITILGKSWNLRPS